MHLSFPTHFKILLLDIWNESQYDVLDVFDSAIFASYTNIDGGKKLFYDILEISKMKEMMIHTGHTYPSDRLTFNIANLTKSKNIRYFSIIFLLNKKFGVEALLEDSKRNFMNSEISKKH